MDVKNCFRKSENSVFPQMLETMGQTLTNGRPFRPSEKDQHIYGHDFHEVGTYQL